MNPIRFLKRIFRVYRADFHAFLEGNPQQDIKFIGVTGTSGKSTTSTMIYHILRNAGINVGIISTVGALVSDENFDTGLHVTTPDSRDLYKIIKKMKHKKVNWIILESSSHSLDQGRFGHLKFEMAVFTNIKRDHLDWHGTWEKYAQSKFRLIKMLNKNGVVIYNQDDINSFNFIKNRISRLKLQVVQSIYSKNHEVKNIKPDKDSLAFEYKGLAFDLNTIGDYNIDNWLAATKVSEQFKIATDLTVKLARSYESISGRMEIIQNEPFLVIVDFAHNADALEKSLISVSNLKAADESKLINVFGSAGQRDVEKRFTMGQISGKYADITIVTAEDPRDENLYDINTKIIEGAESSGAILVKRLRSHAEYEYFKKRFSTLSLPSRAVFSFDEPSVNSRNDAIDFAIYLAELGDVVITEGKGHEKTLAFNTPKGIVEFPFRDQDAVRRALSRR